MRIILLTTGGLALLTVVILSNLTDSPSAGSLGPVSATSTVNAPAPDSATRPGSQAPHASTLKPQPPVASKPAKPASEPLPEPIAMAQQQPPTHISLWQPDQNQPDARVEGIPVKQLQTSPAAINELHVGQKIELAIPQLDKTVNARIETTHNQLNTVQVFKGPLINGHDKDNVIITRGKIQTHVVIATRDGVFSGVIDNTTGKTTLTDEGEIHERTSGGDDGVPLEGMEMPIPSTTNGTTNNTTNKIIGHS